MILAVNVSSINCLSIAYLSIECYYTVIHLCELHPTGLPPGIIKWRGGPNEVGGLEVLPQESFKFQCSKWPILTEMTPKYGI